MANSSCETKELRFVLDKDLTHVYVFVQAYGDSPIGVQGWHYKAFNPPVSCQDILNSKEFRDYLLWPQDAPK